ncbi:hypothetical protein DFH06DRAFT_1472713 [Mycena polygramma]|nr:hypothetical protein DFH06DRAFT_1472713 [Mycena polygramma]
MTVHLHVAFHLTAPAPLTQQSTEETGASAPQDELWSTLISMGISPVELIRIGRAVAAGGSPGGNAGISALVAHLSRDMRGKNWEDEMLIAAASIAQGYAGHIPSGWVWAFRDIREEERPQRASRATDFCARFWAIEEDQTLDWLNKVGRQLGLMSAHGGFFEDNSADTFLTNVCMTMALRHVARTLHDRAGYSRVEQFRSSLVKHVTEATAELVPDGWDVRQETFDLMAVGTFLLRTVPPAVQASMMLEPFYHLPYLVKHWRAFSQHHTIVHLHALALFIPEHEARLSQVGDMLSGWGEAFDGRHFKHTLFCFIYDVRGLETTSVALAVE